MLNHLMNVESESLLAIGFKVIVENFGNKKPRQKPFRNILIRIVTAKRAKLRFILYYYFLFVVFREIIIFIRKIFDILHNEVRRTTML